MDEHIENKNNTSLYEDSNNEEIIEEEKLIEGQEPNILTSMSRDGIRGPYGMDMNYTQENNATRFNPLNSQLATAKMNETNYEPILTGKESKLCKPRIKNLSNESTPLKYSRSKNVNKLWDGGKKKITTCMKRWRKRDPTIKRRGIKDMNPYCIIRDESEYTDIVDSHNTDTNPEGYSPLVEKWCRYEYFYSTSDKCFYSLNHFKTIISKLGLQDHTLLNKLEWCILRKSIDSVVNPLTNKRRRFSDALISDERNKLARFRDIMKVIKKSTKQFSNFKNFSASNRYEYSNWNEVEIKMVLDKIKEFNIAPLEVGQNHKVLAFHPRDGALHTGIILTSNSTSATVQFDREDLGVCAVKDTDMIPFSIYNPNPKDQLKVNDIRDMHLDPQIKSILNEEKNKIAVPIANTEIGENNIKSMAMLQLLLHRKARILDEIQRMNEIVENNQPKADSEDFKQKYAWVSLQLLVTNVVIEPVLTHFRLRKINENGSPKENSKVSDDMEIDG